MNITLTSHACNHVLRLAQGLQSQDILNKLYTIYPFFKLAHYHIEKEHIHSLRSIAAIIFLARKSKITLPQKTLSTLFDHYVAITLRFMNSHADIVQGMSGYCLQTIRAAKQKGIKTIVDRACPHIDFQLSLLDEEIEHLTGKKKWATAHSTLKEKMLAEYEEADSIIVPSTYSYNSFKTRGYSDDKLKIVPLMKEKNVALSDKPFLRKHAKDFTVLAVGFNFYRKGFYYLLKSWNELNLPKAKLIIRSTIPPEFRSLLQHKSIISIDKHLSNQQLIELYHQCDIFCLPSIDEGFGMVALEAMAAAKPIIVTENVGMSDIITHKKEGFVLPIRNIDAIKESILTLYHDRDLTLQMGDAAYQCEKKYSLERYIQTISTVYKKLIQPNAEKNDV